MSEIRAANRSRSSWSSDPPARAISSGATGVALSRDRMSEIDSLWAMRKSQGRKAISRRSPSSPRKACSIVFWSASPASSSFPSRERQ